MGGRIFVSTRKGLMRFEPGDGGWRIAAHDFPGDPVTLAHVAPDGAIYAALALGHFGPKLRRSDDGGATWQEVACPALPGGADGSNKGVSMLWSFASAGERIYCGTIPAGLFASADRGESWTHLPALTSMPESARWFGGGFDDPGIHSILVDPRRNEVLTVGISCGGVWRSEDAGASWVLRATGLGADYVPPGQADDGAIQDPHIIAACGTAPDVMWMQHHNGVFATRDAGLNWARLTGLPVSDFGFAAAAHPHDPNIAWLAPAVSDIQRYAVDGAMAVTKTIDGGRSFAAKRTGLPQSAAYDLVYRHGLAVDESGENLAMGSTTGGFWTSADGGESWSAPDARLPPVNAVIFG
jgi:hypothetical protein